MEKEIKILSFRQKKNEARKLLAKKGFLKKGGLNTFDNYTYFSEAQYKELFVELFATVGLEFYCTVDAVEDIPGSAKQVYAKRVTLLCTLQDADSDVCETSKWIGEAFDRSDKALYKAYTGALKYYFANTFHVPTGDDPELDKSQPNSEPEPETPTHITPWQIAIFKKIFSKEGDLEHYLDRAGLAKIEDMTYESAENTLAKFKEMKKAREEADGNKTR